MRAHKKPGARTLLALGAGFIVFLGWTAVDAHAADVRSGVASTYGYDGLLALPEGPGHRVRVCGPAACIVRTSNDAGPSKAMQRAGRIVDLGATDFNIVCGCRWQTKGLVRVTVEYLGSGPGATVPPTDMEGAPSAGRIFNRAAMVPS